MLDVALRTAADPDALPDDWNRMPPIGRFGEPIDSAYTALYLASDESNWVTGHAW
jgi:NAD(P)-dependent dehydrogenase (short-subunit alcohol dehydrogenase family)